MVGCGVVAKLLNIFVLAPGVFGGLPASGHSFGPAYNATSLMVRQIGLTRCINLLFLLTSDAPHFFPQEMNQMFDFYDGGGLDMTFLGTRVNTPVVKAVDAVRLANSNILLHLL